MEIPDVFVPMLRYPNGAHTKSIYLSHQDVLSQDVKQILWSNEEEELVWRHREDQRKTIFKDFSETSVKNVFYLLWIRVL